MKKKIKMHFSFGLNTNFTGRNPFVELIGPQIFKNVLSFYGNVKFLSTACHLPEFSAT
jgi:hypothetical protein